MPESNTHFRLPTSNDDPMCGKTVDVFTALYNQALIENPKVLEAEKRLLAGKSWEELSSALVDRDAQYQRQFVEEILKFWLWYANQNGESEADKKVIDAIGNTEWKGLFVTILYGVDVKQAVHLTATDRLVPLRDLPRSSFFDEFRHRTIGGGW